MAEGKTLILKDLETDFTSTSINTNKAADLGDASKAFFEINTTGASGIFPSTATQTVELYTAVRNRPQDYFLVATIAITATGTTSTFLSNLGRFVAYKSLLPSGAKPEWEILLNPKY